MTLTVYFKSGGKQQIVLTEQFLVSDKNRRCSASELYDKARSIAQSIGMADYLKHELYIDDGEIEIKKKRK
jgi:hypothetical protein